MSPKYKDQCLIRIPTIKLAPITLKKYKLIKKKINFLQQILTQIKLAKKYRIIILKVYLDSLTYLELIVKIYKLF
jgi:dynactin complex subunit